MKKYFVLKKIIKLVLLFGICYSCTDNKQLTNEEFNNILKNFETPSSDNTVWCYWYWINDDISKKGITKDLEAMKKAGIGTAFIGNINPAGVDGKVPLFSDEWWECMVHAVTEGKRIGVDIGIFNCPGWSQSGGPWVKSDMAMRYLTFSEATAIGPGEVKVFLAKPKDEFQDTHTLAFKKQPHENYVLKDQLKKVKTNMENIVIEKLFDNDGSTTVDFNKNKVTNFVLDLEFKEPISARHLSLIPSLPMKCDCKLFAVIDGEEKLVNEFIVDRNNFSISVGPIVKGPLAISLPEIKSDKFRLICNNFTGRGDKVGFAEINISEAAILDRYMEKQLGKMHPTPFPEWNSYVWDTQKSLTNNAIAIDSVIDVSKFMNKNGELKWNAPAGEWTIMRIGMTPTGTKNSPSAPQGQGYEIDKMSSKLAEYHFENFVGAFLKRIPEDSKSAFKYVIADSYEMGSQNWTDNYEVKFKKKYGYDPVKYLPVLSGRIVGSVEESERFLWDLRRSVADDVAYEYVGGLSKISNKHNLNLWLENYGHWGFPSEFMMYGGQSDLIGGEFWNEGSLGNIECKASSSTSHTYGKGRTSAEAFTASSKSYLRHPAELKKRGDWSYTEGINHFVLHLYIQQPDDNRVPGMNAWFSTEFNRHNSWFKQADNYFDYLRRCQHLLQQGQYVADVCYFIGESTPIMTGGRNPEIPKGYSYDYINAEVIMNRVSVKDGKFVLPDGMTYKVLVLPPLKTMRPEVLAKIEQLVRDGGVVLGSKPEKSPSLKNYPEADINLQDIASKLWGGEYSNNKMNYSYGNGYVLDGYDLESVFEFLKIKKDFHTEDAPVLFTHRRLPGMEIYFITNQSDEEISIKPSFRVKDLKPELWDAVTGERRELNDYSIIEGNTVVPIKLEGRQSWFIVFTNITDSELKKGKKENFPEFEILKTIEGPFTVDFENKEIGPSESQVFNELKDWAKSSDENIKYYSGTANYKTTFIMNKLPADGNLFINLGEVAVMAEVKLNGQNIGGVWIAPNRLNISDSIVQGENELEIEVVNLWRNRLIKDKSLPENKRYTWTVVEDIHEGEETHTSGLLGPVTIEIIR